MISANREKQGSEMGRKRKARGGPRTGERSVSISKLSTKSVYSRIRVCQHSHRYLTIMRAPIYLMNNLQHTLTFILHFFNGMNQQIPFQLALGLVGFLQEPSPCTLLTETRRGFLRWCMSRACLNLSHTRISSQNNAGGRYCRSGRDTVRLPRHCELNLH